MPAIKVVQSCQSFEFFDPTLAIPHPFLGYVNEILLVVLESQCSTMLVGGSSGGEYRGWEISQ